ncbi:MAG TPA: MBL fold metallo-hydrolase [Gemmatimonadaceae bacterium]
MRPCCLLLLLCALWGRVASAQGDSIVVTLLGTGTPNPRIDRLGPSTLVAAGGRLLVFDVGRGTTIRLEQAGIRPAAVTAVFITHFHSDHTNGLPDLWLTGWLPPFGGRAVPLRVIGPVGMKELARGLEAAFAADVRIRSAEERLPAEGIVLQASEFATDTIVFDEGGVRVTAFAVDHGEFLKPAVGYRVSHGGRSVVISGDTRYSDNLVRHARGADLLVHEVAMAPGEMLALPPIRKIMSVHTSPDDAARVFAQVQPRLAVFTHFALPPNRTGRSATPAEVLAAARRGYAGRMELGEDLMRITVGDSVVVRRLTP